MMSMSPTSIHAAAGRALCLAGALLALSASAAVAAPRFTYTPKAPAGGDNVRFRAPKALCGKGHCRYTWYRVGAHGRGAKPLRLGTGRTLRVVFRSTGARWIRLTVARPHHRSRHVLRKLSIATARPPAGGTQPATAPAPPVTVAAGVPPRIPLPACTQAASPATFAAQFAAAQPGQVLCLASGSYGTFSGAAKPGPVTVRGADGATASMQLDMSGASNVSVLNMTITGGRIGGGSHDVTVGGSNFTGLFLIETSTANANVVLNGNSHVNLDATGSLPARVTVYSSGTPSGVTIANSLFQGGDSDGVRPDGDSVQVLGNEFGDIVDKGANHADPIQFYGAERAVIRGNYFHNANGNISAYIMQADGGVGNVIEDNVFAAGKGVGYGITLYSDDGTVIRHNTFQPGTCDFSIPCGTLSLGNKSGQAVSRGTVIRDNILAAIGGGNGTYTADHNLMTGQSKPSFVGPLSAYAGFRLASSSPGRGAASDGADVGINCLRRPGGRRAGGTPSSRRRATDGG